MATPCTGQASLALWELHISEIDLELPGNQPVLALQGCDRRVDLPVADSAGQRQRERRTRSAEQGQDDRQDDPGGEQSLRRRSVGRNEQQREPHYN